MGASPELAVTAVQHQSNDALQAAAEAGLRYVSDVEPGIRRVGSAADFEYRDPDGTPVTDLPTLERIRSLAIPPAYHDVWICLRRNGHLQATGRDARGRKQYRYHPRWQEVRGVGKFDRVIAFGEALPRLRRRLTRDLKLPGFPQGKVQAIVVALLAATLVRIGNDEYARSNKSFGLTTLRNRHVAFVRGGRVRLRFRGKGGLDHDIALDDARLARLIRCCQQLPGQALFQYRDDEGNVQPVDSGHINEYLREAMGEGFTAKDFRTWGGTLAAFHLLSTTPVPGVGDGAHADTPPSERALAAAEKAVLVQVGRILGNTPAVCRKAYVDPMVFARWRDGSLQRAADGARGARQWERAALKFLKQARRSQQRVARKSPRSRPGP
ncbi:MAG: DNA topoisomerase IB [Pseudomonadota bacterium]|nr:DNA topoisomerase IB [Pseudomonadota bacterium]